MTKGNDPVNSILDSYEDGNVYTCKDSITKREYFAALAMQGLLSNPSLANLALSEVAKLSKNSADKLIDALNEKK